MDEILRVEDRYYILSTSSLADDRVRVLKHGDTFAVFDRRGDIETLGAGVQGLYHEESRHLSQWVLRLGKMRPLLLSSGVSNDNVSLAVDLTNPDIYHDGQVVVPRGSLHISRSKFLWEGTHYERLRLENFSLSSLKISIAIQFAADFADIFEARGIQRKGRGERLPNYCDQDEVLLSYRGLDDVVRRTLVRCSPRPDRMSHSEICLDISLLPKAQQTYTLTASSESNSSHARVSIYDIAASEAVHAIHAARERIVNVHTSNEQFNDWLNRSAADLQMMITNTRYGPYPYAGVPWFSTAFGRDGIITALEMLWVNPAVSRGVLSFLADTQATKENTAVDAQPGKILHETRKGEMAATNEVPFQCYYGSVDSTPLFVMLAGAYFRRTADLAFVKQIWPNIQAALSWIDSYGDLDHDGFVEFQRQSANGLVQQGWKDSYDSVSHADGTLAEGPIALCEVQGYVYAAKREAANIANALDNEKLANQLREQAKTLRWNFERAYWCEDLSTYALALDGEKRPCRVRASNAGHCMYTGIATSRNARRLAQTLLGGDFFTGWGIRTLSAREVRYNAMSYHNGSIWPHDNAIIARGFRRYGLRRGALKILTGMLDASIFFELHRLPELFCGFDREPGQAPTLYPVACSPQSWAAGAIFMILESCLGVRIQASPPRIMFRRSLLPESLRRIEVKNLTLAGAVADLAVEKEGEGFYVRMLRRRGNLDIISVK